MDKTDAERQEACAELDLAAGASDAIIASLAAVGQPPPPNLESQAYQWVVQRYRDASAECMCGPLIEKRRAAADQVIECEAELADLEEERRLTVAELAAKVIELGECANEEKATKIMACSISKNIEIVTFTRKIALLNRQIVRAKRKLAKAQAELDKAFAAEFQCTALRRITISLKYDISEPGSDTRAVGTIEFERGVLTGSTSLLTVNGIADQTSTTVMIAKGAGMYICKETVPDGTPAPPPDPALEGWLQRVTGETMKARKAFSSWDQSFLAVAEVRVKDIATRRLRLGVLPYKDTKLKYIGDGCIPNEPVDPLLREVFQQTVAAVPGSLPYTVDFRIPEQGESVVEVRTVQTFKAPFKGTATWIVRIE